MLAPKDDPSNPSADYAAMSPDWELIADIRAGARKIKERGEKYLPRYENESVAGYRKRLEATPWRPEFVDALRNLCSKPFSKEVALQGEPPQSIKDITEDVDGEGNSLHSFSRTVFLDGVAAGLTGIYVTFPDAEPAKTVAAEKASGVRPYWVHLKAENILALFTVKVNGRDMVQHIRLKESQTIRDGFAETVRECVRSIDVQPGQPPTWTLYQKVLDKDGNVSWPVFAEGTISLPIIPIVLFFTGERSGIYRVKAPLVDLANMQLEIYRALSREDEILTYAGSPMLKGKGMKPPPPRSVPGTVAVPGHGSTFIVRDMPTSVEPQMTVGPKTILFAPPGEVGNQPDWDFIQPDAANIVAVSNSVKDKITQFRRLAMQPETYGSGNITATAAAIDSAKSHSAVEAWGNDLKDVLEQAFVFTCQWLKITEDVSVSVHTDFGIDSGGIDETANLIGLRDTGDLSQKTLWEELQRRGVLGPQFDADAEEKRLAAEPPKDPVPTNPGGTKTPPAKKPAAPSAAL